MKRHFEKKAQEENIKIIFIKKRNMFARFFSVNDYEVKFKVGDKIMKGNFWSGIYEPSLDNIYYSILEQLSKLTQKIEFEEKVRKLNQERTD